MDNFQIKFSIEKIDLAKLGSHVPGSRPPKLVDFHFAKQSAVAEAYKAKDWQTAVAIGREWFAVMGKVLAALKNWNGSLPRISIVPHFAKALVELNELAEAEAVLAAGVEAGINDGTKGGLAARLQKLRRSSEK